jgi:hypothetical protein
MGTKSENGFVSDLQEVDLYDELMAFIDISSGGLRSAPAIFSEEEAFDLNLVLEPEVQAAPSFGQARCPGCGSAAGPGDLLCVACGSFLE